MILSKEELDILKTTVVRHKNQLRDFDLTKALLVDITERLKVIEKKLDKQASCLDSSGVCDHISKEVKKYLSSNGMKFEEDEEVEYLLRCANNMFEKVKKCSQHEALAILELTTILVKKELI